MTGRPAKPAASRIRPTAIEVFAGAGGMSLGFEQAGFDVLVAVDNDPVHLATHERNFPLTTTLCADVSTVCGAELLQLARQARRRLPEGGGGRLDIDCIFGGPSCQGFSSIGRRDPKDPRNGLLEQFARLVEEIRPRSFVIENVPGLLSPTFARALDRLTERLIYAGYAMAGDAGWIELDAADFGVPQHRKRVFVIGVRDGCMLPKPPKRVRRLTTVAEALDDLPNADEFAELAVDDCVELSREQLLEVAANASKYAVRMRKAADGYARPRSWNRSCLTSAARTLHSRAVEKRFADTPTGSEETVSRNPRLRADGLSTTLRAGTGRDHGSFSAARPIHHQFARVVTVREAARLHSFPDWFRFHVTKWHGFRQVGNAVPPLLARAVAERLVDVLGAKPERPRGRLGLGGDHLLALSLQQAADHYGYDRSLLPRDSRLSKPPPRPRQTGGRGGTR
jgi:DNA (cytosine-5)-methyltransferase 1